MRKLKGKRGFTLIEIIIVLAVLAVLAAVAIPNVAGFLGRGKERSWDSDRNIIQTAVDTWRTDIGARGGNPWPTTAGQTLPTGGTTWKGYVDMAALTTDKYLKSCDSVKSADNTKNNCTKTVSGSYRWFIDASGIVTSWYDTDADGAVDAGETAFQTDIYP